MPLFPKTFFWKCKVIQDSGSLGVLVTYDVALEFLKCRAWTSELISGTFKSATISGTFESATNFVFQE